jgi:hypothetical protein
MDCNLMLQSAFDWDKKGNISNKQTPKYATVFATVTIHYSLDRPEKTSDLVFYANGPLHLESTIPGQEILTGTIQAWVNKVVESGLSTPSDDDIDFGVITDLFPNTSKLQLLVSVSKTGFITVGRMINGHLIGGMPPSTFQATCENDLLTGMVDLIGKAVCTVSFSLGSNYKP